MAGKKFYIVFNSRGDDGKIHGGHIVSSSIPSIQELMEQKFEPIGSTSTTRYLLREKPGGADSCSNSKDWANYDIDHTEEAAPYATFEEATAALEAS